MIQAGHAAWREREAMRLEARAQQLRRRGWEPAGFVISIDEASRRRA